MSAAPYEYEVIDLGNGPVKVRRDFRWHSKPGRPVEERFWEKVRGAGATECWEWIAAKDSHGYGFFAVRPKFVIRSHTWAYTTVRGPIPDGLQLDHVCENTSCVNPWHLEVVTSRENTRRRRISREAWQRTHCKSGHPLTGDNERIHTSKKDGSTRRFCRECQRQYNIAYRRSMRGVAA